MAPPWPGAQMNPHHNLLEGQLEGPGLLELLNWITALSSTGRLLLWHEGEQMTLGLMAGAVVSASTRAVSDPDDRLGAMACEVGLGVADSIEALAEEQRADARRIGEVLVDAGVLASEEVDDLLELQIYLRVQRIRGWRQLRYAYRGAGVDPGSAIGLPFDVAVGKIDGLRPSVRALHRKFTKLRNSFGFGAGSVNNAIWGV